MATVLACLLVYVALIAPNELEQLTPGALIRVPLEALVGVFLVLVLPERARRVVVAVGGIVLGLLTIMRILDMGFSTVLARPFDPVFDWTALGSAVTFLTDSIGPVGAWATAVGVAVVAVGLVVVMMLSMLRLSRLVVRHRATSTRIVPVLAVTWVACFAVGAQIVTPVPVAAWSTASLAYRTSVQVPTTLRDYQAFVEQSATDAFRDTPPAELLTGLRGKDVIVAFVESYGRSAIEDPGMAPQIDALLDDGTRRLEAAGYGSRSAFLTSPVAGGGSWLAHATMLSGLWVTNQHSFGNLVKTDRLTLTGAFQRAGWETVGAMPGVTYEWPESKFYGIDRVYDSNHLGYQGKSFTGFYTPDQYTMSAFQRLEHGRTDRGPLMAEIPLTSSHWPWSPIPKFVDWNAIGNGEVYDSMADQSAPLDVVWSDPSRVRAAYAQAIEYSLNTLISYVENYGDDNLVLVLVGDHQPAPVVTNDSPNRDVPITIVARDPAVLDQVAGWNWDSGLNPGPQAPVWRMDSFRDRFLTTFGPDGQATH